MANSYERGKRPLFKWCATPFLGRRLGRAWVDMPVDHNDIYYDPCHGPFVMPALVREILSSCPEIKRLQDIGFTNFVTTCMHPLSKVSRLEHSIGVAYLASVFLERVLFSSIEFNNLVTAALLHDVGSAPFGHAWEWALRRYVPFDHEQNVQTVLFGQSLGYDRETLQVYLEPNGFYRHFIANKSRRKEYQLDPELILSYLRGQGKGRILVSEGVDIDNIDNVFRMSHYLGNQTAARQAALFVNSLEWYHDDLLISEDDLPQLLTWLDTRYDAYDKIIYNHEYISSEYMLTRALETYASELVSGSRVGVNLSDWVLTNTRVIEKMLGLRETRRIARRVLLQEFDTVLGLYISENLELQRELTDLTSRTQLEASLQQFIRDALKVSCRIGIHCTTDFRKRFREVSLYVRQRDGTSVRRSFSVDQRWLVIGVLTDSKLSKHSQSRIAQLEGQILSHLRRELDPGVALASDRPMRRAEIAVDQAVPP